ncbi:GNAT family N-acetyltransferase [Flexivirga caeni]|uniref:GNAT family N-acetyltransferase n=1 Tax=Flexivirga caeni TaxID=2294115 RepID=A0A3M9MEB7_9MICO|nr:GNAT family N-acetyltransferase [Flexivirga caeni]RNI23183.1 GNAT family N-acetyltransferase [Flexivirga caeni]
MPAAVEIVHVSRPSRKLHSAVTRLISELSSSAALLPYDAFTDLVSHDAIDLFVAVRSTDVVGMLTLATFPCPTGVRAWIEDVVVSEDARGSGAGSDLVRAAIERAAALGARTIDLTSRPDRAAANRLYQRLGFELRDTNVYRVVPG